jgi:hypothetical protein
MHFYRPLLSCNSNPIVLVAAATLSIEQLVVSADTYFISVAGQWLFLALGNSAFPTCHNIMDDAQICEVGEILLLHVFLKSHKYSNHEHHHNQNFS